MSEKKPTMNPGGGPSAAGSSQTAANATPYLTPPAAGSAKQGCGCGDSASAAGSVSMAPPMSAVGSGDAAPSLRPTDAAGAGITAWQNGKRITALWSINQDRNSWIHIDGVGWKRLSNASISATTALTMLAANAREKNSPVNLREEADGMIHEIYVF